MHMLRRDKKEEEDGKFTSYLLVIVLIN